jgi:hypothetical protein
MRTFEYVEPGPDDQPVFIRKTEEQILEEYYPYWFQQMAKKVTDRTQITREGCIEDWCVVHWATEVPEGKL